MNITEGAELKPAHINSHQCLFCCLHLDYFNQSGLALLCIINDCREAAFVPELAIHCWLQIFSDGLKASIIDQEVLEEGLGLHLECMVINGTLGSCAVGARTDTAGGRWSHDKQAFISEETGLSDPSIFHSLSCWRCAEHVTHSCALVAAYFAP